MGIGIAVAGVSISASAVIITAIKVKAGNGKAEEPAKIGTCPVHHTIEETCKNMWRAIEIIQEDVKELLKR